MAKKKSKAVKLKVNQDALAIACAAAAYMVLGVIWYSKALFFNKWAQFAGLGQMMGQKAPVWSYVGMIIAAVLISYGVLMLMKRLGNKGIAGGAMLGGVIALFFILPAYSGVWFFQLKPVLFWIDAGYQALGVILIGAVLGLFKK